MPNLRPAVFLDRDGTIIEDAGYLADPAGVRLQAGAQAALARLKAAGFALVVVTNQSGIGRGFYTVSDYHAVHERMVSELGADLIDATYFCPEHPDAASPRRKPLPGMLLDAARDLGLALPESYMVGDRKADIDAGRAAGCAASILVRTGIGAAQAAEAGADLVADGLAEAAAWILSKSQRAGVA